MMILHKLYEKLLQETQEQQQQQQQQQNKIEDFPRYIVFPEVQKLDKLEGKGRRFPMIPSYLSVGIGYFLSPSYSFISLAKKLEHFTVCKRFLMPRFLYESARKMRKRQWIEYLPITLAFTLTRILTGVPLEWLIFAYHAPDFLKDNRVEDLQTLAGLTLTLIWTLHINDIGWYLRPILWILSDFTSVLFLADEMERYHKSERIFRIGLLYYPFAVFQSLTIHLSRVNLPFLDLISAMNAASFCLIIVAELQRLIFSYSTRVSSIISSATPPPRCYISDLGCDSCLVAIADYNFDQESPLFICELNGSLVGKFRSHDFYLVDLQPLNGYRLRIIQLYESQGFRRVLVSDPIYFRCAPSPLNSASSSSASSSKQPQPPQTLSIQAVAGSQQQPQTSPVDNSRELQQLQNEFDQWRLQRIEIEEELKRLRDLQLFEVGEVESEIGKLKTQQQQIELDDGRRQEKKLEVRQLEDEKRQFEAVRQQLQKQLDHVRDEYQTQVETLEQRKDDLDYFQEEKVRLKEELTAGKSEFEERKQKLRVDVSRLHGVVDELLKANARREEELEKSQTSCAGKQKLVYRLKVENERRQIELDQMIEKRKYVQKTADRLDQSEKELKQELANLEDHLRKLQATKNKRLTEIAVEAGDDQSIDEILDAVNNDRLMNSKLHIPDDDDDDILLWTNPSNQSLPQMYPINSFRSGNDDSPLGSFGGRYGTETRTVPFSLLTQMQLQQQQQQLQNNYSLFNSNPFDFVFGRHSHHKKDNDQQNRQSEDD